MTSLLRKATTPFFVLLLLLFIFLSSQAFAAACANPLEKTALNARALQSELLVAALSCGQQAQYNNFMKQFGPSLRANAAHLKSYFSRSYPGAQRAKLNKFVTLLTNKASERSLKEDSDQFCNSSASLFNSLLTRHSLPINQAASASKISSLHGIKDCVSDTQLVQR